VIYGRLSAANDESVVCLSVCMTMLVGLSICDLTGHVSGIVSMWR